MEIDTAAELGAFLISSRHRTAMIDEMGIWGRIGHHASRRYEEGTPQGQSTEKGSIRKADGGEGTMCIGRQEIALAGLNEGKRASREVVLRGHQPNSQGVEIWLSPVSQEVATEN
jgi:hypothetical protein